MDILEKARSAQNVLEQLVAKVPGFAGYQEKDLRRDADRLQREHLAARLEENKRALNDLALAATRSGALDVINDVETARKRLDKIVARIRFAERGYAGFFDAIKVEEAALAQAYQFDLDLIGAVDEIAAGAQAARTASNAKAAVTTLIEQIDALDTRFSEREAILRGFK